MTDSGLYNDIALYREEFAAGAAREKGKGRGSVLAWASKHVVVVLDAFKCGGAFWCSFLLLASDYTNTVQSYPAPTFPDLSCAKTQHSRPSTPGRLTPA